MAWLALIRGLCFALYTTFFFTVPFAILWGVPGLLVGALFSLCFQLFLFWNGPDRIVHRLMAREIRTAEAPALFALTREYCRRLRLTVPKLFVLETPAVNLAAFGHTRQRGYLIVTRGAITSLSRDCLGALVARELAYLAGGEATLETTLSQLLSLIDGLVTPRRSTLGQSPPRFYPFGVFLRQIFLYPFCLIPGFLLRRSLAPSHLDQISIRVSRSPVGLSEGLRWMQARHDRVPLQVPFSTRHLFLMPPSAGDPLARVFFAGADLGDRIRAMERMRAPVPLAAP